MKDTTDRVTRISNELRALLMQFEWNTFENSTAGEQHQILTGILDRGLIEDLRETIDQLSVFLWRYIESASDDCDEEVDYALQNERLRRITEVLRLLHRSSCPSQDPLAFVDRVTESVDRHFAMYNTVELSVKHTA